MASLGLVLCGASLAQAADTVQDFTGEFPAVSLGGSATIQSADGWSGRYAQLTPPVGSQLGRASFGEVFSGPYSSLDISFELRVDQAGNGGADGFGFSYLNSANFGHTVSGADPVFGEEPNLAGSLGIGFDTFNNGAGDANAEGSVSLHYNGVQLGNSVALDGTFNLESGLVITATMSIQPDGLGNSFVSVILDDTAGGGTTFLPAFSQTVTGLTPYTGRMAFGARTGGAWNRQAIDNVSATFVPEGGGPVQTYSEDFEGATTFSPFVTGGTPFSAKNGNFQPVLISDGTAAGTQPAHMRLTDENFSMSSSIAFDQTSTETARIHAQFDVKISDVNPAGTSRADGLSFMLLDAADYGTTGNTLPDGYQPFEVPFFANSLGVSFDTFAGSTADADSCPGCAGNQGNAIRLSWNGAEVAVAQIPIGDLNLVNGANNHADISIESVAGGVNLTMTITDGTDGSVSEPFDHYFIAGVQWDGGARVAFGARTGGAADFHELDNVNVSFSAIPEPSSIVLAGIGAIGLAFGIRRKRLA